MAFDLDQMRPYLERTPPYLGLGAGADYADDRFWSLAGRLAPKPALNEELLCAFWQFSRVHENGYDNIRSGPISRTMSGWGCSHRELTHG
jgi:hypothetical protein